MAGDSVVSTPDLGQTSIGTAATLALDGLRAQVDAQHTLTSGLTTRRTSHC